MINKANKLTLEKIIEQANFEYLTNGRSKSFEEIESRLIGEGDISKISKFAQYVDGVDLKAVEYCVANSNISYPNLYFELAINVEGINITVLEDRLIKCKEELNIVEYFSYLTQFACYVKQSDVNKLLKEIIDYPLYDNVSICSKINLCAKIVEYRRDDNIDIDMLNRFVEDANSKVHYKKPNKLQQEMDKLVSRLDEDMKYYRQDEDLSI